MQPEAVVGSDRIYSYRNKAQYPVGRTEDGVVTGFYRVRSHDIIPVDRCLIQTEQADTLAEIVREWMNENHIAPYNEHTQNGYLRYIFVRTGFATGQVLLCLVTKNPKLLHTEQLIERAKTAVPSHWHEMQERSSVRRLFLRLSKMQKSMLS